MWKLHVLAERLLSLNSEKHRAKAKIDRMYCNIVVSGSKISGLVDL